MANETWLKSSVDGLSPSENGDPAELAHRAEMGGRLRLAMELLDERDRQLIVWREWERRAFADIGSEIELGEEAARAAWRRAMERLRHTMARLRQGELDALLDQPDSA
jgi:DNA-directed RNA polymerase specialized sigma24 family protein